MLRLASCPIIMALPLGIIMGDVHQAMIIGAYLQMVYIGLFAGFGGVSVVDKALATCIAIPIAIKAGMAPELAIPIAIPFGLLGTTLGNLKKMINTSITHMADRAAENADTKKIRLLNFVYPPLAGLPLYTIPVTAIVYLGPDVVQSALEAMPAALVHGLSVLGGILPAMGFAITMKAIGRKNLLPFFFAGFFFIQYSKLNTISAAIFGTILALIYVQLLGGERNVT